MSIYAFRIRYRAHQWASGKDALPYGEWCTLMRNGGYTLLKALVNYNPWKPWRWAVFNLWEMYRFLRFVWGTTFDWLRKRHYESEKAIRIVAVILHLLRQDKNIYPAEHTNCAYGYSYFFFERKSLPFNSVKKEPNANN